MLSSFVSATCFTHVPLALVVKDLTFCVTVLQPFHKIYCLALLVFNYGYEASFDQPIFSRIVIERYRDTLAEMGRFSRG